MNIQHKLSRIPYHPDMKQHKILGRIIRDMQDYDRFGRKFNPDTTILGMHVHASSIMRFGFSIYRNLVSKEQIRRTLVGTLELSTAIVRLISPSPQHPALVVTDEQGLWGFAHFDQDGHWGSDVTKAPALVTFQPGTRKPHFVTWHQPDGGYAKVLYHAGTDHYLSIKHCNAQDIPHGQELLIAQDGKTILMKRQWQDGHPTNANMIGSGTTIMELLEIVNGAKESKPNRKTTRIIQPPETTDEPCPTAFALDAIVAAHRNLCLTH